jgi:hypothetical protein
MMICPKAKDCKVLGCYAKKPHIYDKHFCTNNTEWSNKGCPACIPVEPEGSCYDESDANWKPQPDLQTAKDKIIAIQEDILSKAHKKMTDKPQPISTTSDRNIKHKVTGSHMTIQKGKPQPEHCKLGHDWKCTECPEFISDVSDNLSHTQRCMHEIQAEPGPLAAKLMSVVKKSSKQARALQPEPTCPECGHPMSEHRNGCWHLVDKEGIFCYCRKTPAEPDSRKKHCTICGHKEHGEDDRKCLEVVYQDEFSNKQYCQCMGSIEGYPGSREKHCTYNGQHGNWVCNVPESCKKCFFNKAEQPTPTEKHCTLDDRFECPDRRFALDYKSRICTFKKRCQFQEQPTPTMPELVDYLSYVSPQINLERQREVDMAWHNEKVQQVRKEFVEEIIKVLPYITQGEVDRIRAMAEEGR